MKIFWSLALACLVSSALIARAEDKSQERFGPRCRQRHGRRRFEGRRRENGRKAKRRQEGGQADQRPATRR